MPHALTGPTRVSPSKIAASEGVPKKGWGDRGLGKPDMTNAIRWPPRGHTDAPTCTPLSVFTSNITVLNQDRPSTRQTYLSSIVDCPGQWCKYYLTEAVAKGETMARLPRTSAFSAAPIRRLIRPAPGVGTPESGSAEKDAKEEQVGYQRGQNL